MPRKQSKLSVSDINYEQTGKRLDPKWSKEALALVSQGYFEGTCNRCPKGAPQRSLFVTQYRRAGTYHCVVCVREIAAEKGSKAPGLAQDERSPSPPTAG